MLISTPLVGALYFHHLISGVLDTCMGSFKTQWRLLGIFRRLISANPHWEEVQRELLPGQEPSDRPNLIARVFQLKKEAILRDIIKNGIFGRTATKIFTIEFQKRGLPHMHLLIFLKEHKLYSVTAVDSCICTYWPDPETEPQLFKIVKVLNRCEVPEKQDSADV